MLLGFGMGEAREGRVVEDSWFPNLRCGDTAGPTEVGLGSFLTAGYSRLGSKRRPGMTVPRARTRRFSILASLPSSRGTREQTALLESESLEVVAALKESREQSPDSAPVLLPLAALAAGKSGTSEPPNHSLQ